jgi:catechol 2,3-dioxygenase-like lactoylglutathione lyase family enzyme
VTALRFNHVGIGVADVDAAVEWYARVFGLKLVLGPFDVRTDTGPSGQ